MLLIITILGFTLGLLIQVIGDILILEPKYVDAKKACLNFKNQWYYQIKKMNGLNLLSVITCFMTLFLYLRTSMMMYFLKDLMFIFMMILIAYIDFKTTYVYRWTTVITGFIGVSFIALESFRLEQFPINLFLGAFIGFFIIALIVFTTRGMGEGDIEIAALCGLFLGVKGVLLTLFLGIVLGGVGGAILLIRRSKGLKDEMAFGPYLVCGAMISMLWGNQIIEMYLKFFEI